MLITLVITASFLPSKFGNVIKLQIHLTIKQLSFQSKKVQEQNVCLFPVYMRVENFNKPEALIKKSSFKNGMGF